MQVIFFISNIIVGRRQAHKFDIDQERIDHKKIAWEYILATTPILTVAVISGWSYVFAWISVILMHFPVFSTALNKFRVPPRAWNYRNTADPKGSWFDRQIDRFYGAAYFLSIAAIIGLQFLIF